MSEANQGRELTCEEWAERLVSWLPHNKKPAEMLAMALRAAEARAEMRERERCCQLVFGHASSDSAAQRTVDAIRGRTRPR